MCIRDRSRKTVLQFGQALAYFVQMLMSERFIDGNIVVAPTEMRRLRRFLSGSCRSGDCVHMDFIVQQQIFCQRQQSQLNGRSKDVYKRQADVSAEKVVEAVRAAGFKAELL